MHSSGLRDGRHFVPLVPNFLELALCLTERRAAGWCIRGTSLGAASRAHDALAHVRVRGTRGLRCGAGGRTSAHTYARVTRPWRASITRRRTRGPAGGHADRTDV